MLSREDYIVRNRYGKFLVILFIPAEYYNCSIMGRGILDVVDEQT